MRTKKNRMFNRCVALVLSLAMLLVFPVVSFADVFAGSADSAATVEQQADAQSTGDVTGDSGTTGEQAADTEQPAAENSGEDVSGGEAAGSNAGGTTEENASEENQKTEENNAEAVKYSAKTFEGSVEGAKVNVVAPEGALPDGTTMEVKEVASSSVKNAVEQAAANDVKSIKAMDISFHYNGKEIEPAEKVTVQWSGMQMEGTGIEIFHMADVDSAADSVGTSSATTAASVQTKEFSIYVIVGTGDDAEPLLATYKFFNENGTDVISEQTVKTGDTIVEPATPSKAGYKFMGWAPKNTENYFTTFGTSITVNSSDEVDLYPVFRQAYYVFFMDGTDIGSRVIYTKEGVKDSEISVSDVVVPLASNKAVTGWYTDKKLTEKVDSVTIDDANITLYPKIEEGHYITFKANGGSYTEPEFVKAGSQSEAPKDPIRAGYDFSGWKEAGASSYFDFGQEITNDVTLEADWDAHESVDYTVIYWQENANDTNYSFKDSETKQGPAGAITDLDKDSVNSYDGFSLKTIDQKTINGDGSTIVNVYYSRNIYSVKFYKYEKKWIEGHYETGLYWDHGSLHYGKHWVEGHYGDYDWLEQTDLTITAKYGADIASRWPSTTAQNWRVAPTGDTYQSGISKMPLNGDDFYYVDPNGNYTINTYYYTENLNSNNYSLHHTDSFKSDSNEWSTTKEDHYDIEGFNYTQNLKDGSAYRSEGYGSHTYSVAFYYNRNSYDIKFMNEGRVDKTLTKEYQESLSGADYTPTHPYGKEDYVFAGWYDNEKCAGNAYDFSGTMPSGNVTLYAKWEAPKYTTKAHLSMESGSDAVTLSDSAYGTNNIDESTLPTVVDTKGKVISQGDDSHKVTIPDGAKWVGWTTLEDGNYTLYNFDSEVHKNIELYPYYISEAKYTVSYDLNGGLGTASDSFKYASGSYAEVASSLGITAPAGKVFLHWVDANGKVYYPKDKIKVTGNIKLTAKYGPIEDMISLTYHANYPSDITAKEDVTKTTALMKNNSGVDVADNTFTEASNNYVFAGWNTQADGKGITYQPGTAIHIDNNGSNNLYAQWHKKAVLNITITGNSKEVTYTGSEQSVKGYSVSALPEGVTVTPDSELTAEAKGTNAGTYTMNLTEDGFTVNGADNYIVNLVVNDGTLTITPAALTVKVTGNSDSKVYNKSEQKVTGFTTDAPDGVTVALAAGKKAEAKGTDVGTYHMGLTANDFTVTAGSNYEDVKVEVVKDGTLAITPATLTVKVTGNSASKVYNKSEQKVTGFTTDAPDGVTVALATGQKAEAKGTNVGTYNMGLTANDFTVTAGSNYKDVTVEVVKDGTLAITPAALTVKVTGNSDSKVYNKSEQKVTGFTTDAPDGVTVALAAGKKAEAKGTDVGTYHMGLTANDFTVTAGSNYEDVKVEVVKDGTLAITPATLTVKVTGNSASKVYNKSEQKVTGFTTDAPDGVTVALATGQKAEAKGTNVGTYNMGLTANDFTVTAGSNYKDVTVEVVKDGTLAITPAALTVKVTGNSDSKVYNKSEQKVTGFTTDAPDGVTVALAAGKKAEAKGTDVGTYNMGLTANDFTVTAENYTVTLVIEDGQLTITPASLDLLVTGDKEQFTYDGKLHGAEGFNVTTADGKSIPNGVSVELAGDHTASVTAINAGTYPMGLTEDSFTVAGASNYNVKLTVNDGSLKIAQRPITITAGSKSKIFDNLPLTYNFASLTNGTLAEHQYAVYSASGTITDPGTAPNVPDVHIYIMETPTPAYAVRMMAVNEPVEVTDNYQIEKINGVLEVTAQTPTPNPPAADKYSLTINYVDQNGKTVADAYANQFNQNDPYSVDSPIITGYELVDSTQATVAGSMPGQNLTVTVVYKKTSTEPQNPKTPTTPANKPQSDKSADTGDGFSLITWMLIAMIGAAGAVGTGFAVRKREDDNE